MNDTALNILKNLFGVGVVASPLISFLIVRKRKWNKDKKIVMGSFIAIAISITCYVLVMLIAYRAGIFK